MLASLPDYDNDEGVEYISLCCLAVLWCGGDYWDKADVLTTAINPPNQNNEYVCAGDK